MKTIECELFRALTECGAISAANATDVAKVSWIRAARTDKGVHAAGQIVSLKMLMVPEVVARMNAVLPPQIRVWSYQRTNNKFNARTACDSRMYEYLMPTYMLMDMDADERALFNVPMDDDWQRNYRDAIARGAIAMADDVVDTRLKHTQTTKATARHGRAGSDDDDEDDEVDSDTEEHAATTTTTMLEGATSVVAGDHVDNVESGTAFAKKMEALRQYRVTAEKMERLRTILRSFHGTHNFHNYSARRPYQEKSSERHMIRIEVRSHDCYWVGGLSNPNEWMTNRPRNRLSAMARNGWR